jgi:hypothetical protein
VDNSDPREERLWAVLLGLGGVVAAGLLVRQVADFLADAHRPGMQQNDVIAGLGSVAMLAIVGIVAARRYAPPRAGRSSQPSRKRAGAPRSGARARRPRT